MPIISRQIGKIKAGLWSALLTDKVLPFVWVYYAALWVWGIYGSFFAAPATYVLPVMGNLVYDLWVWLQLVATSVVLCGLYIESRGKTEKKPDGVTLRDKLSSTSIRLQTGGHACMFFVLLAYEVSAITATHFGQGIYSIFVIWPYVVGCLLLTVQGMVKIARDGDL